MGDVGRAKALRQYMAWWALQCGDRAGEVEAEAAGWMGGCGLEWAQRRAMVAG